MSEIKSYQKIKPYRNADYLDFIRDHHCMLCGYHKSSAHHVRRHRWGAGAGIKPHDYCTLPLCEINECHNPDSEKKLDVECHIVRYLMDYIKYKKYDKLELIDVLMRFVESQRNPPVECDCPVSGFTVFHKKGCPNYE